MGGVRGRRKGRDGNGDEKENMQPQMGTEEGGEVRDA